MRLIDADELKKNYTASFVNAFGMEEAEMFVGVINQMPTAYDIDKVVEQIHGYFKEQLDIITEGLNEYPIGLIADILSYNKAICKIVKGGAE